MKLSGLSRWVAVLALVIAPLTSPVTAEETATVTITGTFMADGLFAGTYVSGEHTWTATLYGVTHSHWASPTQFATNVSATSFGFQFSGPYAATLNAVVGDKLGGSGAHLSLVNQYFSGGYSLGGWYLSLPSADPEAGVSFSASAAEDDFLNYAFNADADGYPVPPLQAVAYQSSIEGGSAGFLFSYYDTVDVTGDFGSHPPPPPPVPATLSIGDVSVAEGDRGSAKLTLRVALASASDQTVTVDYRTVDGTAVSGGKARKGDYGAASGTLTFLAGETSKTIVISIRSDNFVEADETFTVQLLNAVGAPVTDGVATVTIRNDD